MAAKGDGAEAGMTVDVARAQHRQTGSSGTARLSGLPADAPPLKARRRMRRVGTAGAVHRGSNQAGSAGTMPGKPEGAPMDQDIQARIRQLIEEEQTLREPIINDQDEAGERAQKLKHLEEELDQCWDLLRQRRAKAHAHEDPAEAEVRPIQEVEDYRQ
jgi:hypothetical protein